MAPNVAVVIVMSVARVHHAVLHTETISATFTG